ncbi:hypothetical protein AKJ16_DCAP19022 [Drosera capensis]
MVGICVYEENAPWDFTYILRRHTTAAKGATMAIEGIPPAIAAQLNYLLSNSPFPIRVEQMWSGSKIVPWRDRFTLAIPFCLDFLKCNSLLSLCFSAFRGNDANPTCTSRDVIYNVHSPLAAPDIIFGPEDEGILPFLYSSKGEGDSGFTPKVNLSDWSYKDPSRLISLILHLRHVALPPLQIPFEARRQEYKRFKYQKLRN